MNYLNKYNINVTLVLKVLALTIATAFAFDVPFCGLPPLAVLPVFLPVNAFTFAPVFVPGFPDFAASFFAAKPLEAPLPSFVVVFGLDFPAAAVEPATFLAENFFSPAGFLASVDFLTVFLSPDADVAGLPFFSPAAVVFAPTAGFLALGFLSPSPPAARLVVVFLSEDAAAPVGFFSAGFFSAACFLSPAGFFSVTGFFSAAGFFSVAGFFSAAGFFSTVGFLSFLSPLVDGPPADVEGLSFLSLGLPAKNK